MQSWNKHHIISCIFPLPVLTNKQRDFKIYIILNIVLALSKNTIIYVSRYLVSHYVLLIKPLCDPFVPYPETCRFIRFRGLEKHHSRSNTFQCGKKFLFQPTAAHKKTLVLFPLHFSSSSSSKCFNVKAIINHSHSSDRNLWTAGASVNESWIISNAPSWKGRCNEICTSILVLLPIFCTLWKLQPGILEARLEFIWYGLYVFSRLSIPPRFPYVLWFTLQSSKKYRKCWKIIFKMLAFILLV